MSTTTCLQIEDLHDKPTTFHRYIISSSQNNALSQHTKPQDETPSSSSLEARQKVLLLKGAREQYTLVDDHNIPSILHPGEILVKVRVSSSCIRLPMQFTDNTCAGTGNRPQPDRLEGTVCPSHLQTFPQQLTSRPSSAFNFGIPSLPWINGRDLAGLVLQVPDESSRVRVGDIVLVPSTDYRDIRKAAFQEYAVATDFNAARIPSSTSIHASASLGVAFVASTLALGVSFGLDFSRLSQTPGPNMNQIIHKLDSKDIPADIRDECFATSSESDRPQRGDWLAIWGGKWSSPLC